MPSHRLKSRFPFTVYFLEEVLVHVPLHRLVELLSSHLIVVEILRDELLRVLTVELLDEGETLLPAHRASSDVDAHILRAAAEAELQVHEVGVKVVERSVGLGEVVVGRRGPLLELLEAAFLLRDEIVLVGVPILEVAPVRDGEADPRQVTITLLDEARNPVATYKLRNAQPKKYTGPSLTAKGGGEIAMEELSFVCEGVEYS